MTPAQKDAVMARFRAGDIALGQLNWPANIAQVNNAFRSQLELPVLFYLVSLLSLFTARSSLTLVVLAAPLAS